jgi:hypothetical protein
VLRTIASLVLAASSASPILAVAGAKIDASLLPDTTYTVKVEKVIDSRHILVDMDNGTSTTLAAGRPTVDFSRVRDGDSLKLSTSKGTVLVFLDLTK